jgi:acetoin utilization protein AcuB
VTKIPPIVAVMTPFPHSVEVDASVRQARRTMVDHGIRHLPVRKKKKLVGLLTDRDLKRALDPSLGLPPKDELVVGDICRYDVYVVDVNERLDRVLLHMAQAHIGSALVVKDGKLAGIFTSNDACRCFAEHLRSEFAPEQGDDAA